MKALIREDDVILPNERFEGIDWKTGAPLTNPDWFGGPYTLVENYVPPANDPGEVFITDNDAKRIAEIEELKARLAALENDL